MKKLLAFFILMAFPAMADVNVQNYGAISDAIHLTNGTASGTGASSPTANFVVGDVGKSIKITNSYTNVAVFRGTISSVTNATTIVLSGSVTSTCTSTCNIYYGTDNAGFLNTAFTAAAAIPKTSNDKVRVVAPTATNGGGYMFTSALTAPNGLDIDFEAPLYSSVGIGTGDNTIPLDAGDVSFTQLRMDVSGGRGPRIGQAGSNTAYIHYLEVDNVGFNGQAGLSCQGFGFIIDTINIQKGTIGTNWTGCYDIHGVGGIVSSTGSTYGAVLSGTEDFSFNFLCDTVGTACFTADDAHNGKITARAFVNGSNTSSTVLLGSLATGINKGLKIEFIDESGGGYATSVDYTRDSSIHVTALNSPLNSGITNNITHCVNYGTHNAGSLNIVCDRDSAIPLKNGTTYGNLQDNSAGNTVFYGASGVSAKSLTITGTAAPSGDGLYAPAAGVLAFTGNSGISSVFESVSGGVNYPQFTNAAAGSVGNPATVQLHAKGADADIQFFIGAQGNAGTIMTPGAATAPALVTKGFASQSANIFEVWDSASATKASIAPSGNVNTVGVYKVNATQVVGARSTGWTAPTGTATKGGFATSTVTLPNLAQQVKALEDALIAHGLLGP